ncbi:MAG: DEAD/DEAH box helicase [Rhodobacteraceae bacterium]|nr:DEAD/DEAH box helicase [Paracoccaceae bacterium]
MRITACHAATLRLNNAGACRNRRSNRAEHRAILQKEYILSFTELGLIKPLLETLANQGYETPTPIQAKAIPAILEGRDVVGLAQTGTGKTAAFTLPLLQRLHGGSGRGKDRVVRVLILSPTRELAAQIEKSVRDYGQKLSLRSTCVVGGVPIKRQQQAIRNGVDILVATPGRLEDLVSQKSVRLNNIETIVLDEADQMLDIGFMPAIRRILKLLPAKRQTLLFSATMPREIRKLSADYLNDPIEVTVATVAKTADKVTQSVMHLPADGKVNAMAKLCRTHPGKRIIVFSRTKRGADKIARKLNAENFGAAAIHGNKSQGQRTRALDAFKKGTMPVLIATDIAARGIDVPGVELVVNYDLPHVAESYVHRIGRTARAGASGLAISFCAPDEIKLLRAIERLIKMKIPALSADGSPLADSDVPQPPRAAKKADGGKPNNSRRRHRPRRRAA